METVLSDRRTARASGGDSGQPLRVALFTDSDVFAGTERHILDLAEGLQESGVSIQIACPIPSALAERARGSGLPIVAIQKGGMIDVPAVRTLKTMLASGQLDLVHSHNGRTGFSSALAKAFAGVGASVVTQHFIEPSRAKSAGVKRTIQAFAHRWTNSRITHFIAISKAVRDAMIARGDAPPDKITVVPNGIAVPSSESMTTPEQFRAEFAISAGAPLVVCVARLELEKDIASLIAAMAKVTGAEPAARCVVVGEGSQEAALRKQIRAAGLEGTVTLAGFRPDAVAAINAADVFVLPSLSEPFGLVILEAMALGKPVIATATGGPLEIVVPGQTGVLVPPSQPQALAEAILRLIHDPQMLNEMGRRGRARFAEKFTARQMSRGILEVYKQVVGLRR